MRKLFVSLLAVAALAACSNEDVVRQPASSAISFDGMFVENATRAEDPSIKTGTLEAFDVWGFMNETTGEVFNGTDVTKMGDMWCYDVPQYWMPGNTYYFAALAPMNSQNVALTVASGDAAKLGLGKIAFTNVDGSEDLIYASTSMQAKVNDEKNGAVKFTFNHLLSKIKFTFKNGFAHSNITVDVKDVKMVAPKSGSIDLAVENWWDNDDWKLTEETFALEFGDVETMGINASATAAKERLTIPTDAAYAHEVTFTANVWVGDQKTAFEKKAVIEGAAFEMGKAYNLVATISPETLDLEQIVFEVVEVKDWVYSESPFNMSVAEAELQAVADLGGEYTMTEDINLTAPLVVTAPFTLNLNGHTLTGGEVYVPNTGQSHYDYSAISVVNGADVIINGEVPGSKIIGTSWVVNLRKGTVTIKGGEYHAKVLACQAGNGDDSKATIYIEDGVFSCDDENQRYLLNCIDGDCFDDDANFVVTGGKFLNFDPANSKAENVDGQPIPQNWLAPGYSSYQEGEYFVVIKGTIVRNADEFRAAAADANVDTMIFANDIDFGTACAEVTTDKVIMGNGYKLIGGVTNVAETNGGYSMIVKGGAKVVVDNVVIDNAGGFYINGGSDVTINNVKMIAKFSVNSRNAFFVNNNSTLTVNSGEFDVVRSKNRYFASMAGSKIFVKGGTFEDVVSDDFNPVMVDANAKLEISGGSFNVKYPRRQFDPTPYLAAGYKAERVGDYMVVSAE